jgi:hypothetical protein
LFSEVYKIYNYPLTDVTKKFPGQQRHRFVFLSVIFKKQICPVSESDTLKIYYTNYRIKISKHCLSACTVLWRNAVIIKIRDAGSASGGGLQSVT